MCIKKKAGKKNGKQNKQEKVTAKYIPQKRQKKKLQNFFETKENGKEKRQK